MPAPNPRFETYFKKPQQWRDELNALRAILLDCDLAEELKWRQPCYCYNGDNIVILSTYKTGCVLGFFKGSLLPDPEKILTIPGPNSKAARMLRFTSVEDINSKTPAIKALVKASIAANDQGLKVDFTANKTVAISPELATELKKIPALKKAWDTLTPGRRRSWVIFFDGAKQSTTKTTRIQKAAPKILQGLGFHDEYKLRASTSSVTAKPKLRRASFSKGEA